MIRFPVSAAIGLSIALAAAPVTARDTKTGVAVSNAWARPTPPGAAAGAGYLAITNRGAVPDRLIGASSPAVRAIQLHTMRMDGGIARMSPVAGGLRIAPHATLTLAPGGYHLMLIGPRQPFKPGDRVPATLRFERAGPIAISMIVGEGAPAGRK